MKKQGFWFSKMSPFGTLDLRELEMAIVNVQRATIELRMHVGGC